MVADGVEKGVPNVIKVSRVNLQALRHVARVLLDRAVKAYGEYLRVLISRLGMIYHHTWKYSE